MPNNLKFAFFNEGKDFRKLDGEQEGVKFYRKQILRFGTWRHPDNKDIEFDITPDVVRQISDNFAVGVPVEAPIVLTHTDNPKMKVGGVKQFIPTNEGLDAIFSVDDTDVNKSILSTEKAPGVSCWLDLAYKNKQSNKDVGAVVKHVALVNHPYIEGLGKFEAVSLSEDKEAEQFVPLVMREINLSEGEKMKLEELLKVLKDEHKVDVVKLQEDLKGLNEKVENGELIAKTDAPVLSGELISQIKKKFKLSEDTSVEDAIKALVGSIEKSMVLSEGDKKENVKLQKEVDTLSLRLTEMDGEKVIDALIQEGKVLPAEKVAMLSAYTKEKELFDSLIKPRTASLVELAEKGGKSDETPTDEEEKDKKMIDKQVELAEKEGLAKTAKS